MIRGAATTLRSELMGLSGIVERNTYILRRYIWWELAWFVWTLANTLTIVFIAKGFAASGAKIDVNKATSWLLIGALVWSYLGMVFGLLVEMVQWERWEGTIEHTFMAPLSRAMHLLGTGVYGVLYGIVRTAALFAVVALFFHLRLPHADYPAALVVLLVASISFIGIGTMTSVLPLISPEKGVQLGYIAQGLLLVVSGVYYDVSVLPGWMQALARVSPATYALRALRKAIINGKGVHALWGDIWPLLVIGAVTVPLGLEIFRRGERYAKRHGKLKRSG
ncbi:MAG: ABC transporter permease [Gaiellaceae bacterium]|jgi:ABC-2 type transport system permease protein